MIDRFRDLLLDTVFLGGRVLFLNEQAPSSLSEDLEAIRNELPSLAAAVVSAKDLQSQSLLTHVRDLLVVFQEQEALLINCRRHLNSQVVLGTADEILKLETWSQLSRELQSRGPLELYKGSHQQGCLFLDRDNVVVKNVPYNRDPSLVELMPGIDGLINRAHQKSLWVALVTNQSGLGRGRVTWTEYQAVHQRMLSLLTEKGAWIDECVWAGYYEPAGVAEGRLFPSLRKPEAGMFQLVDEKLRVNFSRSTMVGDSASDLIAAQKVGVGQLFLLHSEKTAAEVEKMRACPEVAYTLISSLDGVLS